MHNQTKGKVADNTLNRIIFIWVNGMMTKSMVWVIKRKAMVILLSLVS